MCEADNNGVGCCVHLISTQTMLMFGHTVTWFGSVGSNEMLCVRSQIHVYAKCRLFLFFFILSSPLFLALCRLLSWTTAQSGNLFELFAYKSGIRKHSLCRGKIYLHDFRFEVVCPFFLFPLLLLLSPLKLPPSSSVDFVFHYGGAVYAHTLTHFSFLSMFAYHWIIPAKLFVRRVCEHAYFSFVI